MTVEHFQFPVSSAQQRLWILDQMLPGSAAYNLSAPIRLPFPVNLLVLKKSLNEIAKRHETLRTTFKEVNGQPVQLVASAIDLDVAFQDLTHRPSEFREDTARQLMSADARMPFDLQVGPLIRTTLFKMDQNDYLFQITMHHIVSDAWSQIIFIKELTSIYEAYVQGKSSPLPDLQIQYADYAIWQQEQMQGDILQQHLDYWRQQLSGINALELPMDKKRPAIQSYQGNIEYVIIPPELTSRIKAFSQQQGATLFMTLLAAFATLLYRYSGQDDIAIGAPVAGRNHAEVEDLIGFFINSLVIRTDLSGNPDFPDFLQRVKKVCLDAFSHSDFPFEKLVEELHPERDMGRNPLFQVSFQIMQFPVTVSASDTGSTFSGFDKGTSLFDLRVTLTEEHQQITGEIEYSTDLFERETIEQLLRNYQALLSEIVSEPQKRLADMSIMTETDHNKLISGWNNTTIDFSRPQLLHKLFEDQASRTPLRTAVNFRSLDISYQSLNNQANQLARFLAASGVKRGEFVGVYLDRSEKMIISFLAILKAGAAYIPLDPLYPKDRTKMINDQAGIKLIITEHSISQELNRSPDSLVMLDEQWPLISGYSTENPDLVIHVLDIAYVIYTSGSTGTPKGVMIPHAAICNHMLWMNKEFPLDALSIVIQRTPYSFDASVWEFYAPLICGARLLIADETEAKDPDSLIRLITRNSATVLQVVPSLLKELLNDPDIDLCTSLKRVYCGGEALSSALIRSFYSRLSAELYNLYGPTEVTIDSTCWRCQIENNKERVPIGKPVSNIQTYVLDEFMNPVPVGVAGELWIGGDGLARGYLQKPAWTAGRFMPDPFSTKPGSRLYRTGDQVRYRSDGNIEYIERIDHQIKLRGYRIEPGEIEATLQTHPMVRQALVLPQPDVNDNQRLVAYVVPQPSETVESFNQSLVTQLKTYLGQKLPDYMIPTHYMYMDHIPLKPNGKLDRHSLPIDIKPQQTGQTYIPPRNELERMLAEIWSQVLGVDPVGMQDNFFRELGGNSLLAIQLISRVGKQFQVHINLQSVFIAPTIQQFSEQLEELLAATEIII